MSFSARSCHVANAKSTGSKAQNAVEFTPNRAHDDSIHPLRQVIAALKCSGNLRRIHALELRKILGILPLEKLDAVLSVGLPPEVAIRCRFLVLGLTERKGHGNRTWAAIERDLDNVRDVIRGH